MDISDDQLYDVFQQMCDDGDEHVRVDRLLELAKSMNYQDLASLSKLDTAGTGLLDFTAFAKGIKRLKGRPAETPRLTRRKLPERRASEPAFESEGSLPSETRNSPAMRRASTIASNGGSSPLEAGSNGAVFPEVTEHVSEQLEQENERLKREMGELRESRDATHTENEQLKQRLARLEQQCEDYEQQLTLVDEESRSSSRLERDTAVAKLRAEKAEVEQRTSERITALEQQLQLAKAAETSIKAEFEECKREQSELQHKADQFHADLVQAQTQLDEATARRERELAEQSQCAELELKHTVEALNARAHEEITELQDTLAALRAELDDHRQESESSRQELEAALSKRDDEYHKLERALRDPREYNRLFVKAGMEIAAERQADSLAAELNGASRDDLFERVQRQAETNDALRAYIDRLLAVVIEKVPEILEVK